MRTTQPQCALAGAKSLTCAFYSCAEPNDFIGQAGAPLPLEDDAINHLLLYYLVGTPSLLSNSFCADYFQLIPVGMKLL